MSVSIFVAMPFFMERHAPNVPAQFPLKAQLLPDAHLSPPLPMAGNDQFSM
jgi:hypothetical protein